MTLSDGKSQTTTWKYDLYGRMTNKVDATSADMFRCAYDANGRLTNRWTPAKELTKYGYDAVGNLTNVDYSNTTDIALSYDTLNRLTNMVDAAGTTRYSYTGFGAVASEDGPWESDTVSYTYDSGRRRSGLTVQNPNASPWSQSYGYDAANRLSNLSSPAGTFSYDYHAGLAGSSPASLVRRILLPNGSAITNRYDLRGRMLGTWLRNTGGTTLSKHEYVLNDLDQRTNTVRVDGSFVDYTYDDLGQLKTALAKESGGVTNRWHEQFRYAYDAAGNLTNRAQDKLTNAFTVNSLNQLTGGSRGGKFTATGTTTSPATNVTVNTSNSVLYLDYTFASTNHPLSDGTNTFTAVGRDNLGRIDTNSATAYLPASPTFVYDSNGNLTYDGHKALEYDDENQLTRITATNLWKSEFTYDGRMRRRIRREYAWQTSAWVLTNEVRYLYDGDLEIHWRNGFNVPTLTLTRGDDLSGSLDDAGGIGGLLARTDYQSQPTDHSYFHADGNGNITALINTNRQLVTRYIYDPFGATLSVSGPLAEANLYRFSSKEVHEPSGMVAYLYRWYNPALQRWINRDPVGDKGHEVLYYLASFQQGRPWPEPSQSLSPHENLYLGMQNNHAFYIDPDGRQIVTILKEAAKQEAKRRAKRAAQCAAIHAAYKKEEANCRACRKGMPAAEAKKNFACWSAVAAGRALYLSKRCDYYLPGSIAAGSKKKAATHALELGKASGNAAACLECVQKEEKKPSP
jgi:RHS repeat-associated protein